MGAPKLDGLVPDTLKVRSARILLESLEVQADIGFHDFEIGAPQRLLVTVEIWLDDEVPPARTIRSARGTMISSARKSTRSHLRAAGTSRKRSRTRCSIASPPSAASGHCGFALPSPTSMRKPMASASRSPRFRGLWPES